MPVDAELRSELRSRLLARTPFAALRSDPPALTVVETDATEGATVTPLERLLAAVRAASSRERVRSLGLDQGFRLEDAALVVVQHPGSVTPEAVRAWLERRLGPHTELELVSGGATYGLAASFSSRSGRAPQRTSYALDAEGRALVEAFEVHVVEHCNLRCSSCCNLSPLVAEHTLDVSEVAALCGRLRGSLRADVIKVMGGEPTLHPDLTGILRTLRESGLADRVRLFTNGLRLGTLREEFWSTVEDLTISNYASVPVKPALLALAHEKSARYGFVLNVKPVTEFSRVLSPRYEADDAKVRTTFERCWLRHRCLIARQGRFFMCTRAAYAPDFLARTAHEEPPATFALDLDREGVPLEGPELATRIAEYMNRTEPLSACRYCHGGDGPVERHAQLTRHDVAAGRLSVVP